MKTQIPICEQVIEALRQSEFVILKLKINNGIFMYRSVPLCTFQFPFDCDASFLHWVLFRAVKKITAQIALALLVAISIFRVQKVSISRAPSLSHLPS